MMKLIPTEAQEQIALMEWAAITPFVLINTFTQIAVTKKISDYLIAIPNGGSRHKTEAFNLKRQGVRPGASDLFFAVPRGKFHGLWIELKRKKGGELSFAQSSFILSMQLAGYKAVVAHGFDEARSEISSYLSEKSCDII